MIKAVFLDRDGIINVDKTYVSKIEDFEFVDGIFELLLYFISKNYKLFIVTDQSGIGIGNYSQSDYDKVTDHMLSELFKKGIKINDVFYCPHNPSDNCNCRKPKTGMVDELLKKSDIDLENSWMIGDKDKDISFGHNISVRTIRVHSHFVKSVRADFEVDFLFEIFDIIE